VSVPSRSGRIAVLFLSPVIKFPPADGPSLRVYNILRTLAQESELHVHVMCSLEELGGESAVEHLREHCASVQMEPESTRPGGDRGVFTRIAALLDPWRHWRRHVRIVRLAREVRAQVLWCSYGNLLYHFLALRFLAHRPMVIDTDSVWSRFVLREWPFAPSLWARFKIAFWGGLFRCAELLGTNVADVTTAVSEVDRSYYDRLNISGRRVMRLSNVVDPDHYGNRPGPQLARPALCMSGWMASRPNWTGALWLIERVMPIVWDSRPEIRLYIVGKGPPDELLRRQTDRVIVTGSVDSVVPYLRNATAALVPLFWESGTRFKILEAFATGTPVISTALGAEGLEVTAGEHLLIADDPMAFAEAILRILDEPELGGRLSTSGHSFLRRSYALENVRAEIRAILDHLLDVGRSHPQ
jgi:glycosyltransferase involved in cell wall biosynthesis